MRFVKIKLTRKLTTMGVTADEQQLVLADTKKTKFVKSFAAGSLSGSVSTILFQPFEVVKTRVQNTIRNKNVVGYVGIIKNIKNSDGLLGFWRGLSPALVRAVPSSGLYFYLVHILNENMIHGKPTAIESILIGAVSQTSATVCFNPFTVMKTRFESKEFHYRGIFHALQNIYATEGIRGFSRGLMPTIIRDTPFSGLYYFLYIRLKELCGISQTNDISSLKIFGCGVTASCLATIATQPADALRTYMQLYPSQFSQLSAGVTFVYKHSGFKGYFIGLYARLLRRASVVSLSWTIYEQVALVLKLKTA